MNDNNQNISDIELIFEDDYLVVVNKPNNLLVHHSHYARNIQEASMMELLNSTNTELHLIHRLDRKTSGIILLVKKKEYISAFQKLFQTSLITKNYLAVVRGYTDDEGKIDSPIRIDESDKYKNALTHFKTLAKIELKNFPVHPYHTSRYSLVMLSPKTGRQHQLRKHMNKISHPIIGDHKYGDRFHNRNFETNFGLSNLFLHAHELIFEHPFLNKKLHLSAKLPDNWSILLNKFNWTISLNDQL